MQIPPPMIGLLIALIVSASVSDAHCQTAATEGSDETGLSGLMQQLARAFRGAEQSLTVEGLTGLASHAGTLSGLGAELSKSGHPTRTSNPLRFRSDVARLRSLAEEIGRYASDGDRVRARAALSDLRKTCVACHVSVRAHGVAGFPAQGGALMGRVSLSDARGKPRSDRSGVIVFLDGDGRKGHALPRKNPIVSQTNRSFSPRILPILVGTTVDFPNDDKIYHNVFSLSGPKTFDLDVYGPGKMRSVTFPEPGVVRTYCNIHPKMNCSILVLNNPYFTMTDRSGEFVLPEVPDGAYLMRSWNEFGATSTQRISVRAKTIQRIDLSITEKYKALVHLNKFGKRYRGKYR